MRLQVKKLFGKKDYDIKFNDDLSILIGPNGCGKSTILKILNCIFENDLISLSRYDFEEITFFYSPKNDDEILKNIDGVLHKVDQLEIKILRKDIVPLAYVNDVKFKVIFKNFLSEYDFNCDINDIKINFDSFMEMFDVYFKKEKSGIEHVAPYVEDDEENSKLFFDYCKDNCRTIYSGTFDEIKTKEELNYLLYSVLSGMKSPYGCRLYFYNMYLAHLRATILDRFNLPIDKFKYKMILNEKIIYAQFNIFAIFYFGYHIENRELCSNYYDSTIIRKNENDNLTLIKVDNDFLGDDRKRMHLMYEYYNSSFENLYYIRHIIKSNYDDYVCFEEKSKYDASLLTTESFVRLIKDLCNPINQEVESNEYYLTTVDDFSKEEKEKIINVLNFIRVLKSKITILNSEKNKIDYDNLIARLCNDFDYDYKLKILKKLQVINFTPEDYVLRMSTDYNHIFYSEEQLQEHEELDTLMFYSTFFRESEFVDKVLNINLSLYIDSEEALSFYEMTNKYFINKRFVLNYDDNGSVTVTIYDKRNDQQINENMLSSGEYKILRLIKTLAFSKKVNFYLLDEPELSLSVYWQSMIVDHILKYGKRFNTMIATQSPYIVKEEHVDYLVEVTSNE